MPTFDFSAFFRFNWLLLISDFSLGVLLETLFVGRQYSFALPCPHGFPVRVSFHFSAPHLFNEDPAVDFLTCPLDFRHLAICCDARADGNTFTRAFTFL